jgi:CheY-like chemotaxis protein
MANIMLIDDDPVLLKLYSTRLSSDGHQVTVAGNGEVAIDLLKTDIPDIIVVDLLMPKLNGFSFLEYLNSHPQYDKTIRMVFSSVVNQEQIARLTDLRVAKYLNKIDTTPTQLVEAINNLLPQGVISPPAPPPVTPPPVIPPTPPPTPTSPPIPTPPAH